MQNLATASYELPTCRKKSQWRDTQNRPSDASYLSGATGSCRTSRTGPEAVLPIAGRQILERHLVEKVSLIIHCLLEMRKHLMLMSITILYNTRCISILALVLVVNVYAHA